MGPEEIVSGTEIIGFDYLLPVDAETTRAQIRSSLAFGLREALYRKPLAIIANGPSAKGVNLGSLRAPTLALNGALDLFLAQGLAPDYWAVCDPQEIAAGFIPEEPPAHTIYLVASKCHPKVFERLKGCDVRLWHVDDHPVEGKSAIPPSSSITITATWLMHRLGFTDFEYWGWDGCFIDDCHHAAHVEDLSHIPTLNLNYGGTVRDGEVIGGRTFTTTRTWACEAKGAEQFFQLAKYFDIGVKINGDGMFECARQILMAA